MDIADRIIFFLSQPYGIRNIRQNLSKIRLDVALSQMVRIRRNTPNYKVCRRAITLSLVKIESGMISTCRT